MNKIWVGLSVLLALLAMFVPSTHADHPDRSVEQLVGSINYVFVGHKGETDDADRLLVWESTIQGDLNGELKWWFVNPGPVEDLDYSHGRLTFYSARWELWVDAKLLLAGVSAGKTDFRNGADGVWDGHGRVTEAHGKLRSLQGRNTYETGTVLLGDSPPQSLTGSGMFHVY